MNNFEKEFLQRIKLAYEVYSKNVRPDLNIENFITWLYKEYGFIEPKGEKYGNTKVDTNS